MLASTGCSRKLAESHFSCADWRKVSLPDQRYQLVSSLAADTQRHLVLVTATPHNLIPEESGEPVAAVLEIAGGEAARLGIAEDDKVSWSDR